MTTWSDINVKLDTFLGREAEEGGKEFKNEKLRVESWNWAQQMFVAHTPRQRQVTLSVESDGRSALLPADFYAADGIYDSDYEQFWRPVRYHSGDIRYLNDDVLQFWTWENKVILESEVSTNLTLYYWAYYPDIEYSMQGSQVTTSQGVVYTPGWAELPLIHLTVANVLQPMELFASNINQYKIRVESGNPEHNPRAQSALYHLNWYETLTNKFPRANTGRAD